MTRLHCADFGRTGPAVVQSCGCAALPWQECGCKKPEHFHLAVNRNVAAPEIEPWDAHLSLARVIERQQLDMTQYPDEPENGRSHEKRQERHRTAGDAGATRPPLNVLLVLARCRRMAEREMSRGRRYAKEAKRLIADIEAVAQGGLPG
jgi:hypothetical protein